ncbi:prohibitin family protein [Patescibacteria group bacterium]|nr:prohibitin family protein [Patescibacteria group bacterium]MCG2702611.1 prohibitin family protein [Candidatus Parcubacteria bacterium]MBU4210657.1 prohibitin family protein [Patescibacteria group bacterium]MBU4265495.1 prohibitin family protein [Patescibacteria group bacterium]MBU4390545.1 prohibitin family protein [Patescibacteria group bacterium]
MASIDNLLVSLFVDEVVGGFLVTVPPGHVGCIYSIFRGVLKNVWYPGMHFKIPLIHRAKLFNAQLIEYTISKDVSLKDNKEIMGDEVINAVTADNKFVNVEATVLIKLDTERLPEIWQNIGENFVSKVVRPVTRSRIRKVLTNYTLNNALATSRSKIEDEVKEELRESLQPHGLFVDNFYLSSLTPIDGEVVESGSELKMETGMPKNAEEIRSQRGLSGNLL